MDVVIIVEMDGSIDYTVRSDEIQRLGRIVHPLTDMI